MSDTTPKHDGLASALAAFQGDMPTVSKSSRADVGQYSYTYANLASISSVALPILSKHGLAFTCRPQHTEHGLVLEGRLLHESGEFADGELPLNGRSPQELGSSITYMRRYLFGCLTGIVTDDDDDGAAAQRHAKQQTPQGNAQAAAEYVPPPTPPRAEIMAKLDEACEALGKTRAQLTKKWRDTHNVGAVAQLDDAAIVPDAVIFQYVQSLQPYVEQAKRQQQAAEPEPTTDQASEPEVPEPTDDERKTPDVDAVICDATRPHPVVERQQAGEHQKCTLQAGHEGDHAWW